MQTVRVTIDILPCEVRTVEGPAPPYLESRFELGLRGEFLGAGEQDLPVGTILLRCEPTCGGYRHEFRVGRVTLDGIEWAERAWREVDRFCFVALIELMLAGETRLFGAAAAFMRRNPWALPGSDLRRLKGRR